MNLILSKYEITNQIAQTADVCKVMYVTLPINSDWIGDRLAKQCLLRRNGKNCHSQENI